MVSRKRQLKILVDINHPAHVHFFKHLIWEAQKMGHQVLVTASQKEIAQTLLQNYQIPFIDMGSYGDKIWQKILMIPVMDWRMWRVARKFKPDLVFGIASVRGPHVAKIMGAKAVNFDDTGHKLTVKLYYPFIAKVYSPYCFKPNFGLKQIRYRGFHQLAHLWKPYFKPKPINHELGLKPDQPYFIVRFVGWGAGHDLGQGGFTQTQKIELVKFLAKKGKVLITSEKGVPEELKKYVLKLAPEKIFDLMAAAKLVVSEGATMASEAAFLGTPAVCVTSLACDTILEQEKHGLMRYFQTSAKAIRFITNITDFGKIRDETKAQKYLQNLISPTKIMLDLVQNHEK